jgi:hypothetical protein
MVAKRRLRMSASKSFITRDQWYSIGDIVCIDNPRKLIEEEGSDLEPSFRDYIERHHDQQFAISKIQEETTTDRHDMPIINPMYYVYVFNPARDVLLGEASEEGFYHNELKSILKKNQEWDM